MKTPDETMSDAIRERWTERPGGGAREDKAGALLRLASVDEPLSDARMQAVLARVSERPRRVRHSWAFQLAFGLAVILGGATLVVAATRVSRWIETRARVRDAAPVVTPAPRAHRHGAGSERSPAIQDAPAPPPVVSAPPPAPFQRVTRAMPRLALNDPGARAPGGGASALGASQLIDQRVQPPAVAPAPAPPSTSPPPSFSPPPSPSALAAESALLARALHVLRQDKDARGALELFDQHAARFGGGSLAVEEKVGRAEALLQLGRRAEALALLDTMDLPSRGGRRDMLVTRGELRAGEGRCAEALIDFGVALTSEDRADGAAERALYGRASCRARLGDADGARADLVTYLARFPAGRFAADARATLGP